MRNSEEAKTEIISWFVIILFVTIYCNLGVALGYGLAHIKELSPFMQTFVDPWQSTSTTPEEYTSVIKMVFAIFGPILFAIQWITYLIYLMLGGIAVLLFG